MSRRLSDGPDLQLAAGGDELRHRNAARHRLRRRAGLVALLCGALLGSAAQRPTPSLVWNASASAPLGLYAVAAPETLQRDDWVVARPPADAARLAAIRGYLPLGVPLIKRIVARPGDHVCADDRGISVNGHVVARRLATDGLGRPLPLWRGCGALGTDAYLLINADVPRSFDGRYFGPSRRSDILGKAGPLWLR